MIGVPCILDGSDGKRICFGMSSTLTSFDGKYYEYHGGEREYQGLAISGYKSAFLADLVASYIFENSNSTSNRQPTTESTQMTAWWCLKERRVQEKLNTGQRSIIKQWTRQKETNTYNSPRKYGRYKITPQPLRRKKEFKS